MNEKYCTGCNLSSIILQYIIKKSNHISDSQLNIYCTQTWGSPYTQLDTIWKKYKLGKAKKSTKFFKFGQNGLPELAGISGVQADTEFLITFSESAYQMEKKTFNEHLWAINFMRINQFLRCTMATSRKLLLNPMHFYFQIRICMMKKNLILIITYYQITTVIIKITNQNIVIWE